MEIEYFRIICVDENPLEYRILEDTNKGSLEEVHSFVRENYAKHKEQNVRWLLLPAWVKNIKI
jgi:hypothetical protein